jgi:predicted DNA-binding transcriptional regulator AlpA
MSTQFLTEMQVAERTHISLATLRRWRLENRGPKYRKFGSLVRYDVEELAAREQTQPSGGGNLPERVQPKPAKAAELLRRSG